MKTFKLQIDINGVWTTVTSLENITPMSSFDEKLKKGKHHRYTLTFSMMSSMYGTDQTINYFATFLTPANKVRLTEYQGGKVIEVTDFIITSVVPTALEQGVQYNVTAEDAMSQQFVKFSNGLSLDILNKNIKESAEEIIANSELANKITIEIENPGVAFKSILDGSHITASLLLSNSNLYNALIELALLFNANIKFDYVNGNKIILQDITSRAFKGYRFNKNINITGLQITDSIQNFTTALKIHGKTGVAQIPPTPPTEVSQFLGSQVNFKLRGIQSSEFTAFNTYAPGGFYKLFTDNKIPAPTYESAEDNAKAVSEIKKFLTLCDFVPSYSNVLYNFDYFLYNKNILSNSYKHLHNGLYNQLRKLNIKISLATEAITASSIAYSTINGDMETYAIYLNTECNYCNKNLAKDTITASTIQKSVEKIKEYLEVLDNYITYNSKNNNDLHKSIVNMNGFTKDSYTTKNNEGFRVRITEIVEKSTEISTQINELNKEVTNITNKLNSSPVMSVKIVLESEKAGAEARIKALTKQIDATKLALTQAHVTAGYISQEDYNFIMNHPIFHQGIGIQNMLKESYFKAEYTYAAAVTSGLDQPSLFELLYVDKTNDYGLITLRDNLLNSLYDVYGSVILESLYTNDNEVNSYGLFEQAYSVMFGTSDVDLFNTDGTPNVKNLQLLKQFYGYRTPNRSIGLNFIELSAIEGFDFLTLDVNDKIELSEPQVGIDKILLETSALNYDLRNPGNSTLEVQQLNESENILQKLLALL